MLFTLCRARCRGGQDRLIVAFASAGRERDFARVAAETGGDPRTRLLERFLGLLTFPTNILLGLGIMLAANEVPRIAQQFGLDTSAKFQSMVSVVHTTSMLVNMGRQIARGA